MNLFGVYLLNVKITYLLIRYQDYSAEIVNKNNKNERYLFICNDFNIIKEKLTKEGFPNGLTSLGQGFKKNRK